MSQILRANFASEPLTVLVARGKSAATAAAAILDGAQALETDGAGLVLGPGGRGALLEDDLGLRDVSDGDHDVALVDAALDAEGPAGIAAEAPVHLEVVGAAVEDSMTLCAVGLGRSLAQEATTSGRRRRHARPRRSCCICVHSCTENASGQLFCGGSTSIV